MWGYTVVVLCRTGIVQHETCDMKEGNCTTLQHLAVRQSESTGKTKSCWYTWSISMTTCPESILNAVVHHLNQPICLHSKTPCWLCLMQHGVLRKHSDIVNRWVRYSRRCNDGSYNSLGLGLSEYFVYGTTVGRTHWIRGWFYPDAIQVTPHTRNPNQRHIIRCNHAYLLTSL